MSPTSCQLLHPAICLLVWNYRLCDCKDKAKIRLCKIFFKVFSKTTYYLLSINPLRIAHPAPAESLRTAPPGELRRPAPANGLRTDPANGPELHSLGKRLLTAPRAETEHSIPSPTNGPGSAVRLPPVQRHSGSRAATPCWPQQSRPGPSPRAAHRAPAPSCRAGRR